MTEAALATADDQTGVGSYFVANYPPFSVWTPVPGVPLGVYLHIPFCRKRCHFCYFRVYTDKNAQEVADYLDVLVHEWELLARTRALRERPMNFVYFGGGTPSFLAIKQLESLVQRLSAVRSWDDAEEITFECEPGTLTPGKLDAIRGFGVTRLSLGVESFDDQLLELNGRAHRSPEIFKAYEAARALAFPQINIDLIAGMLGETEVGWADSVRKTIALEPDSVTIYQMELPFNTTISSDLLKGTHRFAQAPANWSTKRRWVREAFGALEGAGYELRSAYTAVKHKGAERTRFVYTDRLWDGADLVGLGVASFGHVNGVHMQNLDRWETYRDAVKADQIPLSRAYRPTPDERLIREVVLQFKRGSIRPEYFRQKYGVNVLERFREPIASLERDGFLAGVGPDAVTLTRDGLLQVDVLIRRLFLPEHAEIRYT
jgi:oxygen-independent coproporphyrinogen-3 oxidase